MDHRQLLKKYIAHVGIEEGVSFLSDYDRNSREDSMEFTDEEWAELQKLDKESLAISAETHLCSCHNKGIGPCDICKELGCFVMNMNRVATLPSPDPDMPPIGQLPTLFHGPHYDSVFIDGLEFTLPQVKRKPNEED